MPRTRPSGHSEGSAGRSRSVMRAGSAPDAAGSSNDYTRASAMAAVTPRLPSIWYGGCALKRFG